MDQLRFFDRNQEFSISRRKLPHWSQAGTVCFITWRTADSLPRSVVAQLAARRREILQQFGIAEDGRPNYSSVGENAKSRPVYPKLAEQRARLSPRDNARLQWLLFTAWDEQLHGCRGACLLASLACAEIVLTSLRRFDGERYRLTDAVVMPNHVHVLVAFSDGEAMRSQVAEWKRFTAREINRLLGRAGPLWQDECFDHLVRSAEQFESLRRYVAENPRQARLGAGRYLAYSRPLG
ncbi:MAG TPA: transposase [Lacipirellulaceae bacterium]|nr:transposase [Lacipirellulaceae bacterium]